MQTNQMATSGIYTRIASYMYYISEYIVVVKKTFRYSNVFFYNRTFFYAALPYFGTLLWKTV